jgi:hypothetical protein
VNLVQITPGAGGMYCGNCFRDNALVSELRRQGHDTVMVPMYLPMTLDEAPALGDSPTFFGGINVFLSQKSALHRRAPAWFRRWFDSPRLLKWAAGKTAKTRAEDVGELTVSMLRGESGNQHRELEEMVSWMSALPRPDAVFLSNALLAGLARKMRSGLRTKVVCFLQSEESFLDMLPEPFRSESWRLLAERAVDIDGWIAPTRYFADRMASRLRLPPERVRVAPSGISLDGYRELPQLRYRRWREEALLYDARAERPVLGAHHVQPGRARRYAAGVVCRVVRRRLGHAAHRRLPPCVAAHCVCNQGGTRVLVIPSIAPCSTFLSLAVFFSGTWM